MAKPLGMQPAELGSAGDHEFVVSGGIALLQLRKATLNRDSGVRKNKRAIRGVENLRNGYTPLPEQGYALHFPLGHLPRRQIGTGAQKGDRDNA